MNSKPKPAAWGVLSSRRERVISASDAAVQWHRARGDKSDDRDFSVAELAGIIFTSSPTHNTWRL